MRNLFFFLLLPVTVVLPAFAPATAQESVPAGFELWSADAMKQLGQELANNAASEPHRSAIRRFTQYANDYALLAHRDADGVPEWHDTEADIFFVQTGAATLLFGGTLEGAQTMEPNERRNGKIVGGIRRKLSPGDVIRIPAKTPHQILLEGAHNFTYFVIKVKGY